MSAAGQLLLDLRDRMDAARDAGADRITITSAEFDVVLEWTTHQDRPEPAPDLLRGLQVPAGCAGLLFGFPVEVAP